MRTTRAPRAARPLAACTALLACAASAAERQSVYDIVLKAKVCHSQAAEFGGDLECNYRIGKGLHIAIVSVGEEIASVKFFRSSFDGDFYGSFATLHGCVVVQPGKAAPPATALQVAFISPKNGKVYRTWQACQRAE